MQQFDKLKVKTIIGSEYIVDGQINHFDVTLFRVYCDDIKHTFSLVNLEEEERMIKDAVIDAIYYGEV
ncbi:MAG: hypothetical protein ACRCXK_10055 [Wohlfahrtiimonas sp.]